MGLRLQMVSTFPYFLIIIPLYHALIFRTFSFFNEFRENIARQDHGSRRR